MDNQQETTKKKLGSPETLRGTSKFKNIKFV